MHKGVGGKDFGRQSVRVSKLLSKGPGAKANQVSKSYFIPINARLSCSLSTLFHAKESFP